MTDTVEQIPPPIKCRTPPPRGQGTSKTAQARRRRAAKKAAVEVDDKVMAGEINAAEDREGRGSSTTGSDVAKDPSDNLRAGSSTSRLESPDSLDVVEQKLDNLFEMIRQERDGLFKGPQITVYAGSEAIRCIYKRVVMASSSVLNRHFVSNPKSNNFHFEEGSVSPTAIRYLLSTWMEEMCKGFEIYEVPVQIKFAENVALLRASRLLGMERYTRQIMTLFINYLKTELPSYEEIVIVEKNATSDKDPLWTSMVNHLCHDRFKKLMPDPGVFEEFLQDHPRLSKAMESADAYFAGAAKKKWEANKALWEAKQNERHAHKEKNEAEKREQISREWKAAESLKQKMNTMSGSGLLIATAEEAMLLRKL